MFSAFLYAAWSESPVSITTPSLVEIIVFNLLIYSKILKNIRTLEFIHKRILELYHFRI